MGMADIAEVLWNDFLKHNPTDPTGMIATALFFPTVTRRCCSTVLHLTGYDLPLEELKNFRQLHSKTPATRNWLYARR